MINLKNFSLAFACVFVLAGIIIPRHINAQDKRENIVYPLTAKQLQEAKLSSGSVQKNTNVRSKKNADVVYPTQYAPKNASASLPVAAPESIVYPAKNMTTQNAIVYPSGDMKK